MTKFIHRRQGATAAIPVGIARICNDAMAARVDFVRAYLRAAHTATEGRRPALQRRACYRRLLIKWSTNSLAAMGKASYERTQIWIWRRAHGSVNAMMRTSNMAE